MILSKLQMLSFKLLFRSRVNVVLLDGPCYSFRKLAATRLSSLLFSTSHALTFAGSLIKAVPAYITTLLSSTAELVHRFIGLSWQQKRAGEDNSPPPSPTPHPPTPWSFSPIFSFLCFSYHSSSYNTVLVIKEKQKQIVLGLVEFLLNLTVHNWKLQKWLTNLGQPLILEPYFIWQISYSRKKQHNLSVKSKSCCLILRSSVDPISMITSICWPKSVSLNCNCLQMFNLRPATDYWPAACKHTCKQKITNFPCEMTSHSMCGAQMHNDHCSSYSFWSYFFSLASLPLLE